MPRTFNRAKRSLLRLMTRRKCNRKSNTSLKAEMYQAGICTKIASNVLLEEKKKVSVIV